MDVGRFNGKAGELDLRDGAVIGMRISGGLEGGVCGVNF
jgi:hypothetical protein